mmetsp:Transcript_6356/g.11045  ORF Transcript_6356/g.11045 Transcript_6356/m.11045 type:complete len:89 (-) Transcript_6356:34-300(-)
MIGLTPSRRKAIGGCESTRNGCGLSATIVGASFVREAARPMAAASGFGKVDARLMLQCRTNILPMPGRCSIREQGRSQSKAEELEDGR